MLRSAADGNRSRGHLAIVATGGTIANTAEGRIPVEDLISDIRTRWPSAIKATVRSTEVVRESARTFTPDEWLLIARAVSGQAAMPSVRGVVVTHGTLTAEETAYFLHLVVHTRKPVVLACSQRKHGSIGNDGDRNLVDALRVAASPMARGRGVLVVMDEEIHSARDVRKTNQRPGGFSSGGAGILGSVEADRVTFYRQLERRHTARSEFDLPNGPLPRVDILATYAGADGAAVHAVVAAGARGIVLNGFSFNGLPHPFQAPALAEAAAAGIPVILVNRGRDGRVPIEDGDQFIRGDNLTAEKARVLLALALARGLALADLQRVFSEY